MSMAIVLFSSIRVQLAVTRELNSANLQKFEFEIFIYLLSDKRGQWWDMESVKFVRCDGNVAAKKDS